MVGTLEVVIIAAAGSLGILFVAIFSIFLGLRARDRRLTEAQLTRYLVRGSRIPPGQGNADYSHIPHPRTKLRQSGRLSNGTIQQDWTALRSSDTIDCHPPSSREEQPDQVIAEKPRSPRKSFRATFSAQSFSVPKTRRQRKIAKAIPLHALPHSPLSAITEKSGTNTIDASPSTEAAELPTELTPRTTPERDETVTSHSRPSSNQWPLPLASHGTFSPIPLSHAPIRARIHSIKRAGSVGTNVIPRHQAIGVRSASFTSVSSTAPDDPLPPLPPTLPRHWNPHPRSKMRLSMGSLDTIGSSLLGDGQSSPSQVRSELPSPALESGAEEWHGHNPQQHRQRSITLRRTELSSSSQKSGGQDDVLRKCSVKAQAISKLTPENDCDVLRLEIDASRTRTDPPEYTDTNDQRSSFTSQAESQNPGLDPSLQTTVCRTATGCRRGIVASRHSMYEQCLSDGRVSADSDILGQATMRHVPVSRYSAASRPASVATDNPYQWDGSSEQNRSSYAASRSPESPQKCRRADGENTPTAPSRESPKAQPKCPQIDEENVQGANPSMDARASIPGLELVERQRRWTEREKLISGKASIIETRPILAPALTKPRDIQGNCRHSPESSKQHDSDVFRDIRYHPDAPNIFNDNVEPGQSWPLPSSPERPRESQITPPRLATLREDNDPDSPTLPLPTLSSAAIFANMPTLGTRTSAVQGPRHLPRPDRTSRSMPRSPTKSKRDDLRRSAMTVNRIPSRTKENLRISQVFRYGDQDGLSNGSCKDDSARSIRGSKGDLAQPVVSIVDLSPVNNSSAGQPPNRRAGQQSGPVHISPSKSQNLAPFTLRTSRSSRISSTIARSPSNVSTSATSIWEDASIRDSSPEPDLPPSSTHLTPSPHSHNRQDQGSDQARHAQNKSHHDEGKRPSKQDMLAEVTGENIDPRSEEYTLKHQRTSVSRAALQGNSGRDRGRERTLTSPHDKGLGISGVAVPAHLQPSRPQNAHLRSKEGVYRSARGSLYDGDGFLVD